MPKHFNNLSPSQGVIRINWNIVNVTSGVTTHSNLKLRITQEWVQSVKAVFRFIRLKLKLFGTPILILLHLSLNLKTFLKQFIYITGYFNIKHKCNKIINMGMLVGMYSEKLKSFLL